MTPSPLFLGPTPSPALLHLPSFLLNRQGTCALECLGSTPTTCTSLQASCLCAEASWGPAVMTCIQSSCATQASLAKAFDQLEVFCASGGVTLTLLRPSFTKTAISPSKTVTENAALSSSAASVASSMNYSSQGKAVNVSAIMASICSLLFVIALILAFFAIRERIRRTRENQNRMQTQTWGASIPMSHVGSSSHKGTRLGDGPFTGSLRGTTTISSSNDAGMSYADLEREAREERLDLARLRRQEEIAHLRGKNIYSLFDNAHGNPSMSSSLSPPPDFTTTTTTTTTGQPSPSTTTRKTAEGWFHIRRSASSNFSIFSSDFGGKDDDGDLGQYVAMPDEIGLGGVAPSTLALVDIPQSTFGGGGASGSEWGGFAGESQTALSTTVVVSAPRTPVELVGKRSRLDLDSD